MLHLLLHSKEIPVISVGVFCGTAVDLNFQSEKLDVVSIAKLNLSFISGMVI